MTHLLPRRRSGVSLIEIVMAMAMLTAALVPIAGLMSGTARQTAATKAEASAAATAATLMNTFLDRISFDDDVLSAGVHTSESNTDPNIPGGANPLLIDGTEIRWTLEVADFLSNAVTLQHWRVKFFDLPECPPDSGGAFTPLPTDGPVPYRSEVDDRSVFNLDSKAGRLNGNAIAVMKEFRLTVQWKSPRDPDFETIVDDDRTLQRTAVLITRRARLSKVTP